MKAIDTDTDIDDDIRGHHIVNTPVGPERSRPKQQVCIWFVCSNGPWEIWPEIIYTLLVVIICNNNYYII